MNKAKTRKEMAQELGISYSTFSRLIRKLKIMLPKGLIYPSTQEKIYTKLKENQKMNGFD